VLVTLADALHRVGQPAHRLEQTMVDAAAQVGQELQIFALPTGLIMSFKEDDGYQTRLSRIEDSGIHLERLARLSGVADRIVQGKIDPAAGKRQLEQIMHAPERWGPVAVVAAYLLSASAFAVFFRGGLAELITAVFVGLAVGLLAVATQRVRVSRRLFELASALAAAWIATLAGGLYGPFVEWIPLAAGLIILLPGMATVDAVEELSNGHLAAGGARLAGVAVVFLAMTFGTVLGIATADYLMVSTGAGSAPAMMETPRPLPLWATPIALVAVSVGSMIRFRARESDLLGCLLASFIALAASRLGTRGLGPISGAFLAALVLGAVANLWSRRMRQPVELFDVPGLAILVPGSIGLRCLASLLSDDTATGVHDAFQMFVTAMAIVAGLLFSNSIWRQRGVF
ncbi:MAG: threonine/serine exporter family protein, partial [Planctomycetaceae bacterium]|nr:threonine/serine exporter family protein [Planctomycetaceae bacterium]